MDGDGGLETEQATHNSETEERISPREIDGLEKFLAFESIGGNAGSNRAGANSIFLNTAEMEFLFTNSIDKCREHGRDSFDVTFGVKYPPIKSLKALLESGKTIPPPLIDEVTPLNDLGKENIEQIRRRAKGHNAKKIIDFLVQNGEWESLPPTEYSPTREQVEEMRKPA